MKKILLGALLGIFSLCSCGTTTYNNKEYKDHYENVDYYFDDEQIIYRVYVDFKWEDNKESYQKKYELNVNQVHYVLTDTSYGKKNDLYVYTHDYLLIIYKR